MQDFFKIFEIFGANGFFIISFLGITAVYRFMIKTIEDERRRSDENLDKILELQNNSNKNIVYEMKEMVRENKEHNEKVMTMLNNIALLISRK